MLHQKLKIVKNEGVKLLCAHGWAGQIQLSYWRRISQSEIRNSAAAEKNWNRKARAGKNSFPPTPFLFARLIGRPDFFASGRRGLNLL